MAVHTCSGRRGSAQIIGAISVYAFVVISSFNNRTRVLNEMNPAGQGVNEITDEEAGDEKRFRVTGTVGKLTRDTEQNIIKKYGCDPSSFRTGEPNSVSVNELCETVAGPPAERHRLSLLEQLYSFGLGIFYVLLMSGYLFLNAVPIIVIIAITRFEPGQTPASQRSCIVLWLFLGSYMGMAVEPYGRRFERKSVPRTGKRRSGTLRRFSTPTFFVAVYGIPAVCGFVVVGQMMADFGVCTELMPGAIGTSV
ncbi:hypothetical protein GGR54DRAFT_505280 [Hypoxylon sp. NC1633]|nr:hypothetical protein GGR54DRAFT_505280 [Hypoxylon sp. NC1633]